MTKKKTTEEFIKDAIIIHGHIYDYSLVRYFDAHKKIKIICKVHGIFEQKPNSHLSGRGCRLCWLKTLSNNLRIDTQEFLKRAKIKHGEKYDYSLIHYVDSKTPVKIICPIHGIFEQIPNSHLSGRGCIMCGYDELSNLFSYDKKTFIALSNKIFQGRYNYDLVQYINNTTPVKIICPIHGIFLKRPDKHLIGQGCPFCSLSNGIREIANFLTVNHIEFEIEKSFKECRDKRRLPFDFYFEFNFHKFLVEYDGCQHFDPIEFWGGLKSLKKTQYHDSIKNQFAQENGFILIRIPYTEFDNIETILTDVIKTHS